MNALSRGLFRPLGILALGAGCAAGVLPARGAIGAEIPWTTIEAEAMRGSGTLSRGRGRT